MSHASTLLRVATEALAGRVEGITIRRDGDLALLNAGKELLYTGYSQDAELLKGLIVEVRDGRAVRLVAGCLPKFYNLGEDAGNDAAFHDARDAATARMVVTEKVDGTNVRPYVAADGSVRFATRGMLLSEKAGIGPDFSALARGIAAEKYPALLNRRIAASVTFVLELIHPSNRIVTDYGDREDLVLLAAIDLDSGEELHRHQVVEVARDLGLTVAEGITLAPAPFDDQVETLRSLWSGTDLEGAVIAIEDPLRPSPFRIKVKAERYLLLTRLARGCTLRRTAEAAEAWGATTWEAFRERLVADVPEVPEEVVMGYREHFLTYQVWATEVAGRVASAFDWYDALPERDADQKTFALAIAHHETWLRAALFAIRKVGVDAAGPMVSGIVRKAVPLAIEDEPEEVAA